jgi:hypothetical protein
MAQFLAVILIVVLIKMLVDNIKPFFNKNKPAPSGDFIDISEKWINADDMPYQINKYLLNKRELMVFKIFEDVLNKTRYSVYPHVRMADLLSVPTGTQNRQEYLFRIKERSLDMVVFDSSYLTPILVINLKSQEGSKRQQISDQFTENALRTAGLKSVAIDSNNPPGREELLQILRGLGLGL